MTCSNQQIVTAFEDLHLQPEDIASEFDYDIVAVKAILMQNSSAYRKLCNTEPEGEERLNFTEDDLQMANDVIRNKARYAEDEYLQFKAATYIRDDKLGRKNIIKEMPKMNISIVQFNMDIQKAVAAKERARAKTIDILSEVRELVTSKAA